MDESEDEYEEGDSLAARKPLWIWIAAGLGVAVMVLWILGYAPF
jgi:hypothetical protein